MSGVHAQPLVAMERSGRLERLGPERAFGTFAEAAAQARQHLEAARSRTAAE